MASHAGGGAGFASQDPKVISVFEVVGSFFVDVMFNHIYGSAKAGLAEGKSLTDEYVRLLQTFVKGIKGDAQCYSTVVRRVHSYFTTATRFTTLSFSEFVDHIVGACSPEEFFRSFTHSDKDELLSSILCDLVSNLAVAASRPEMLRMIIDEHSRAPKVTIRALQNCAIEILVEKRNDTFNRFMKQIGQARETISREAADTMKAALRRLAVEKAEAATRAAAAEKELGETRGELRILRDREAKLRKLVRLLNSERAAGPAAAGDALRAGPAHSTIAEEPARAAGGLFGGAFSGPSGLFDGSYGEPADEALGRREVGSLAEMRPLAAPHYEGALAESRPVADRRPPEAARLPLSGASRPAPVSADFFKTFEADGSAAAPAATPPPRPLAAAPPQRPTMLSRLLASQEEGAGSEDEGT